MIPSEVELMLQMRKVIPRHATCLAHGPELTGGGGRIEAGQPGPEGHGLRPVWFAVSPVCFVCLHIADGIAASPPFIVF